VAVRSFVESWILAARDGLKPSQTPRLTNALTTGALVVLAPGAISCHYRLSFSSSFILASFDSPVQPTPVRSCPDSLLRNLERKLKMKNIFVGNLSFNASEGDVRAAFEAYGTVDRVSIVTDRDTGQQRGFAFVEMTVDAEGDRAIAELNGRDFNGRALNVNEARPKGDRGSSGGGYRGNGGGSRQNNRW
jgi:hypothetical protein